jgi:Protein of unknown function (DUF3800)
MYLFYLDEFGHVDPDAGLHSPVFGYGGLVLPADTVAAFATHFFDFKTAATRHVQIAKLIDKQQHSHDKPRWKIKQESNTLNHLLSLNHDEVQHDPELRRLNAKAEVKGEDIFSRQYVNKLESEIALPIHKRSIEDPHKKLKGLFQYAKAFLKIARSYDCVIFYYGEDKRRYDRNTFKMPMISFVKPVLERAYEFGARHNSTVSLTFDHHTVDDEPENHGLSSGPRHSSGGPSVQMALPNLPTGKGSMPGTVGVRRFDRERGRLARKGPRLLRAQEIVSESRMFELITEPITSVRSHESQLMQAADWISYLLSQIFPYLCGPQVWPRHRSLYENLGPHIFGSECDVSEFKFLAGRVSPIARQAKLPLGDNPIFPNGRGVRPYHNIRVTSASSSR